MSKSIRNHPTNCDYCNKIIMRHPYEFIRSPRHFCNNQCKGKWMSEHLIEEKSANWQGGLNSSTHQILNSSRYRRIRQIVIDLDDNKCSLCNSTENLQVHHIIEKSKRTDLLYDMNNMVTVCRNCHFELHRKEQELINYFNGIVANRANSKNPVTDNAVGNLELSSRKNLDKCVETIHPSRKA